MRRKLHRDRRIEVVGGMSDDEFAVASASLPSDLSPGVIVEADPHGDADPDDIAEPTGPAAA
jgi:hypothetical protein